VATVRDGRSSSGILKSSGSVFINRIILLCIKLGTSIITARMLGPEGRGILVAAMLVPYLMRMVCEWGLNVGNVWMIGQKRISVNQALTNAIIWVLAISFVGSLFFMVCFPVFGATILRGLSWTLLLVMLVASPWIILEGVVTNLLLLVDRVSDFNGVYIVDSVLYLLFLLIAVVLFPLGVEGAVLAQVLSTMLAVLVGLVLLKRAVPLTVYWDWPKLRETVSYGAKGHTGTIAQALNQRLDSLLVNWWIGPVDLGYYSLAVSLAEMLRMIPQAINTVVLPKLAKMDQPEADKTSPQLMRLNFAIILATTVVFFALSRPLVLLLYSEAFLPSLPSLWLLLPGMLALGFGSVSSSYLAGRGHVHWNSYGAFIALAITIILDLALIPTFGISGAAIASSASYSVVALIATVGFLRKSGANPRDILLITPTDLTEYVRQGRGYVRRKGSQWHDKVQGHDTMIEGN
jgi:O-antigen/teichoic acid export membrane protein